MTQDDFEFIKQNIRAVRIESLECPEWGTWGVMEDNGEWFEILGARGGRVLHYSEALRFWRLLTERK